MLGDIGKKIKEAREDQGISQKDLGMSLGLSDKAVSAYEASRTVPPLETLIRIAEELNKPLDYFIKENSPDYKVETRIASMEQTVTKLLLEIRNIREQLNIPSLEDSDKTPQNSQDSPLNETPANPAENPLDDAPPSSTGIPPDNAQPSSTGTSPDNTSPTSPDNTPQQPPQQD